MLEYIILILKGIVIGFGKIIPGVSGSMLAIVLNVYEKALEAISNLFHDFKRNVVYLGFLGLGIIISIVFGSKILVFMLNYYYFYTFSFIVGLIIGTIPSLTKKIKIEFKSDFLYIIIPFLVFALISHMNFNFYLKNSCLIYFLIGFIEAVTTIIPGISSTAIYMSFGIYSLFLDLFSNIFSIKFMFFSLGLFLGVFSTAKIISYLFKNYSKYTYLVIFSILISSILTLIYEIISVVDFNVLTFFFFLIIGFVISKALDK